MRFSRVPDVLDDPIGPVVAETDRLAEFALRSEQALDLGIGGPLHVIDVVPGDAELFGIHHRHVRPANDIRPLVVAMANHRAERLLRDDVG